MLNIVTALVLCLLWLHLVGVGLIAQRFIRPYPLARVCAPLLVTVLAFFVEHFYGFGRLGWVWLLTTPLCASAVYQSRTVLHERLFIEACALGAFIYALAWRWTFPDIDGTVERLSDLGFVANYLPGDTLPPVDTWFPPYKFDFYYSLQHYGAALLGRWFGLDIGTATNLAFCTIISLTAVAAAETSLSLCPRKLFAIVVVIAFLLGGSGASALGHFMVDDPNAWFGMRFVGELKEAKQVTTNFGQWFVSHAYPDTSGTKPIVLPIETLGFDIYIAEYHSTLAAFLILAIKLYAIALLEREPDNRSAHAVMAASLPLCILANVWILPFQALMLFGWIAYRYTKRMPPDWKTMLVAGSIGLLLAFPHLRLFSLQSVYFDTSILLVPADQHTPLVPGLALLWPLATLILFGLINVRRHTITTFFPLLWAGLWVISELFYIEDAYGGEFNRFNSTLKWWPHIYGGALLSLGAMNLNSSNRVVKYGSLATLLAISSYGYDLGRVWLNTPKPHMGRLDGAAWITDDLPQKAALDYLKSVPPGIVLERLPAASYTYAPSLAMFSGHRALLGWSNGHEELWRGSRSDIGTLFNEISQFYQGTLDVSLDWLLQNNVTYIVWTAQDNVAPYTAFQRINDAIRSKFDWNEFRSDNNSKVGVWVRRQLLR